jgi:hypothetical protein
MPTCRKTLACSARATGSIVVRSQDTRIETTKSSSGRFSGRRATSAVVPSDLTASALSPSLRRAARSLGSIESAFYPVRQRLAKGHGILPVE